MKWEMSKSLNHGVSHPVVARLAVQTSELVGFSTLSKEKRDAICELYMSDLQRRLLKCHDIFNRLQTATREAAASAEKDQESATGRVVMLPAVVGLVDETESFLYEVKNYLRDLLHLFRILFDYPEEIEASKFYDPKDGGDSKLVKWASATFGDKDQLTILLRSEQGWIGQLIRKRNAIEHPGGRSGTLAIHNVRMRADRRFIAPSWSLDGEPETDIYTEMSVAMENLLTIGEDLLAISLKKFFGELPVEFYEIPLEQRDALIPKRLKAGLRPELMHKLNEQIRADKVKK